MKKQEWEYLVISISMLSMNETPHQDEALLNKKGAEGWELVSVARDSRLAYSHAYFKRPKEHQQ